MFLFLSFVVAVISLYYLGVMASTYGSDTTYLMPLVALLIYSITNIIRELKNTTEWLLGDEPDYNSYSYRNDRNNVRTYADSVCSSSYNRSTTTDYVYRPTKPNERTENFVQDKKVNKDDEKFLIHYPSRSEAREKIKELEKSRWFRIKRSFAGFFGVDITEKYYKPRKVKSSVKVKSINKEDDSRFMPQINKREYEEYNAVAKFVGRSCEIAFGEEALKIEENDG